MIVLGTKCTYVLFGVVYKNYNGYLLVWALFLELSEDWISFFWLLFDNVLLSVLIFFFIFRRFDLFWWAIISFIFSCMLPNSPSLG